MGGQPISTGCVTFEKNARVRGLRQPCQYRNMLNDQLEEIVRALQSGPSTTDWISAIAAVLTTLLAIGALIYAAKQIDEAKAARTLASQLEVERAQPYVVLYTEESPATNLAIDLVLKNFGPTAARDVRVSLDPWPEREDDSGGQAKVGIPAFPVLAPGQEWRTSWVWTPHISESDIPRRHEGKVTFRGIEDAELESPVVLDLGIYTQRRWTVVYGIHDAAKALREMEKNQKKWTEGPRGGLSVVARDGDDQDKKRRARREEQFRIYQDQQAQTADEESGTDTSENLS